MKGRTHMHERKDERADGQSDDTCLYLEVIDVETGSETGWMDWSSEISVDNGET